MICEACRERRHGDCRGGTWCDCQHKPTRGPRGDEPGEQRDGDQQDRDPDDDAEPAEEDGSEPRINWLRQG